MTVRQILNAAYAKSKKNVPGQIASEATELKGVVFRALVGLYSFAARLNPLFFAETDAVAYAAPGWPKPAAAESIFRIETAAGAEIIVVPFDQRDIEAGNLGAVYFLGTHFRSAGNVGDPGSTDTLTFFYSKRPDEPATVESDIDATWDEAFNELLIIETALYLATKDADPNRAPEIQQLAAERNKWARLYAAHLEHLYTNEHRQYAHVRTFNTQSIVPLDELISSNLAPAVG